MAIPESEYPPYSPGEYIPAPANTPISLPQPIPAPEDSSLEDAPFTEPDSYNGSPLVGVRTSNLRSPSAAHAGRDEHGKVIPHSRNEEVAKAVAQLVALGATLNHIAVRLNLRPGQIKEYYAAELEHSTEASDLEVVAAAHRMATSGEDAAMTKFWLQHRKKWQTRDDTTETSMFNIHIHTE